MISKETKVLGKVPVIGFGTGEITGHACIKSVNDALELGYRHIDTAQRYDNEREVGQGIKSSEIDREEIFVTTKISTENLEPSKIRSSFQDSLKNLDMDYVDLLLIHWPTSDMDLKACLETMFGLREEGYVKHVGVSNFNPDLFQEAIQIGPVLNNQIKFTPQHSHFENLDVAKENDKIITAYSPLEKGDVARDKTFKEIGDRYGKSASQISLRWLIQLGNISVIPRSQNEYHRRENLDIFDFELSEHDMETIEEISVGQEV